MSSLCSKQLEASSIIPSSIMPSNQKLREAKSILYICLSYTTALINKNSFINKSNLGIIDTSKSLY